jgi:hypothetical protein
MHAFKIKVLIQSFVSSTWFEHHVFIIRQTICTCSFIWYVFMHLCTHIIKIACTNCLPDDELKRFETCRILYINYLFDAQITIYSYNITILYIFRTVNAHLQEVPLYTCSIRYCYSLGRYTDWVRTQSVYRSATTTARREWRYHMLHVYSVSSWRWAFMARNM